MKRGDEESFSTLLFSASEQRHGRNSLIFPRFFQAPHTSQKPPFSALSSRAGSLIDVARSNSV